MAKRSWKIEPGEVEQLEAMLARRMQPVAPRNGFVANLEHQLSDPHTREPAPVSTWDYLFFGLVLFSSLVLIIGLGIRLILALLAALGLLERLRDAAYEKRS